MTSRWTAARWRGAFLDIVEKGTGSTLAALMQRFLKIRMLKPPPGTVIHKPREVVGEYQGRKYHRGAHRRAAARAGDHVGGAGVRGRQGAD